MTVVLGLDPSLTSFGVAVVESQPGQPLRPLLTMHCGYPNEGESWTVRSRRVSSLYRAVTQHAFRGPTPDLAMFEAPVLTSPGRDAQGASFDRAGVTHAVLNALVVRRIPIVSMVPQHLKQFATGKETIGKGNASKNDVYRAVQSWWPRHYIANDDESDALVVATAGALHLGASMPFTVRDYHRNIVRNLRWDVA